MNEDRFSTFCHISQYGEQGYRELARMVAMSRAALWAPSSYMLKSEASSLTPEVFLKYLEAGKIRVFGRQEWLCDPASRNERSWLGSAWDNNIDGEIKRICEQDESRPKNERSVVIAPPERGYEFADIYLDQHPEQATQWARILRSRQRRLEIPNGTREAALRETDIVKATRRILRDAYNHGAAIAFSDADAPLLVQRKFRKFWNILADAPPLDSDVTPAPEQTLWGGQPERSTDWNAGELADELLYILSELDIHSGGHADADRLDRFVNSQGREDLMRWLAGICLILRDTHPGVLSGQLDGILTKRLRQEIQDGRFPTFLETFKERKDESAVGSAALVFAALGLVTDPTGIIGIAPLGLAAYSLGKGLMREMGYVPGGFTGPQWPFIYTSGTYPTRRQVKRLQYVLSELFSRKQGN